MLGQATQGQIDYLMEAKSVCLVGTLCSGVGGEVWRIGGYHLRISTTLQFWGQPDNDLCPLPPTAWIGSTRVQES